MKQTISITLLRMDEYSTDEVPEGLVDFSHWLNELIEQVPSEYRDNAYIEFDLEDGEYNTPHVRIYYTRPETDHEEGQREAEERAQQAQRAEWERQSELRQLAALKRKYEQQ